MIIEVFISIFLYIANLVLSVFSSIINFGSGYIEYDISSGVGMIFGNLMSFNTILPVTEALALAVAALAFKAAILGFEIFMFTIGFLQKTKTFFVTWR